MKTIVLIGLFLLPVCLGLNAQKISPASQYVAATSGLILREEAILTVRAVGKIPYGEKLEIKEKSHP